MNKMPKAGKKVNIPTLEDFGEISEGKDSVDAELEFVEVPEQQTINSLIPSKMLVIIGTPHQSFLFGKNFGFCNVSREVPDIEKLVGEGKIATKGEVDLKITVIAEKKGLFRQEIKPVKFPLLINRKMTSGVFWEIRRRYFAVPVVTLSIPRDKIGILKVNPKLKQIGMICPSDEIITQGYEGQYLRCFWCPAGAVVSVEDAWYDLVILDRL